MLRREGYASPVTIISADQDAPVDRPNLSKDYLAGEAQDDWMPMWPPELYAERHVELVLGTRVASIDPAAPTVTLENGSRREFGALLLATGADPVRLPVPGTTRTRFSICARLRIAGRSWSVHGRDARRGRRRQLHRPRGLGLAADARHRGRRGGAGSVPLERVMGVEIGRFVQSLHETHGVVFHLGQTVASVAGTTVR